MDVILEEHPEIIKLVEADVRAGLLSAIPPLP
jgi:hypothetical protein